ncbi:tumor necrosis factor receptor superfamily member 19-like [Acipenser oxyrinchus oxyrinchus]|uniref:Tumor necrosis factor receptor superfamily member 19-like n=1 Tax=Acipenser oxyrinchus oxyrinchus TaxID=40147 RepID=A0AAD8CEN9_ACIOX|nr:tumor necrosis factor receptor superfamily member 19-like [Acipenser oxyrinchus oxyrinchus]
MASRDTALAAVICSALTTVLLALLILCIIYCKRQLIDKKPSWSVRSQEAPCNGAELLCFDRHRMNTCTHRTCCHCHSDAAQTCGPVHLIPSLCCDETCSLEHNSEGCPFHSQNTLDEGNMDPVEAWPLMRHSASSESLPLPRRLWSEQEHRELRERDFTTALPAALALDRPPLMQFTTCQ